MNVEWIRRYCMSLPHSTETVQWGDHLVFKIGGKIYAVAALEPAAITLSFKCAPEEFAELTERPGIIQAPYFAKGQWVALEGDDALTAAELKPLLKRAYELIFAKLPKKTQVALR
jgi:predicted DNA-binding protein (MmcQ/YjbR family)